MIGGGGYGKLRGGLVLVVVTALIAVPWILFPKPFILKKLHKEV
jgi:hypothetical protein